MRKLTIAESVIIVSLLEFCLEELSKYSLVRHEKTIKSLIDFAKKGWLYVNIKP